MGTTVRTSASGCCWVALGAGWLITTLAESSDELPYTVGCAAGGLVEVVLGYVILWYVILWFLAGRLPGRIDRLWVGVTGGRVPTLFQPRLALAHDFDVPSPMTSCIRDCI